MIRKVKATFEILAEMAMIYPISPNRDVKRNPRDDEITLGAIRKL